VLLVTKAFWSVLNRYYLMCSHTPDQLALNFVILRLKPNRNLCSTYLQITNKYIHSVLGLQVNLILRIQVIIVRMKSTIKNVLTVEVRILCLLIFLTIQNIKIVKLTKLELK